MRERFHIPAARREGLERRGNWEEDDDEEEKEEEGGARSAPWRVTVDHVNSYPQKTGAHLWQPSARYATVHFPPDPFTPGVRVSALDVNPSQQRCTLFS